MGSLNLYFQLYIEIFGSQGYAFDVVFGRIETIIGSNICCLSFWLKIGPGLADEQLESLITSLHIYMYEILVIFTGFSSVKLFFITPDLCIRSSYVLPNKSFCLTFEDGVHIYMYLIV